MFQRGEIAGVRREIIEITSLAERQPDTIAGMQVEPSLRHVHGDVGTEESDGEKQRLFAIGVGRQLLHGPLGDSVIRHVGRPLRKRTPVPQRMAVWLTDLLRGSRTDPAKVTAVLADCREDLLIQPTVEQLADTPHAVSGSGEGFRNRDGRLRHRRIAKSRVEEVQPGRRRQPRHHEARPRGLADGSLTVGVTKIHATGGQSIDVRRACLWMAGQAADPIIQVVDTDQHDIGGSGLNRRPAEPNAADRDDGEQPATGSAHRDARYPLRLAVETHCRGNGG